MKKYNSLFWSGFTALVVIVFLIAGGVYGVWRKVDPLARDIKKKEIYYDTVKVKVFYSDTIPVYDTVKVKVFYSDTITVYDTVKTFAE